MASNRKVLQEKKITKIHEFPKVWDCGVLRFQLLCFVAYSQKRGGTHIGRNCEVDVEYGYFPRF